MYSCKVVVFLQSSFIRAKWFYLGKWLYSGKSGCTRAKVVVIGQSGCIREKWLYYCIVAVILQSSLFEQRCCIREKWLYSDKSGCIIAKWL